MAIRDRMLAAGVITRAIGADTLTFCPPLVITDDQIDRIVDVVVGLSDELTTSGPGEQAAQADGDDRSATSASRAGSPSSSQLQMPSTR